MMTRWFVIGIGGVTCSGKTTLATKLHKLLKNSIIINQDDYFLPEADPRHVHDMELNHHNWDIITSLDMEKMYHDVTNILTSANGIVFDDNQPHCRVLILDGIFVFNYKPIAELCDVKYFLSLTKADCWERRRKRVYNPPDVPGYFEKIVWPEYENYKMELEKDQELWKKIIFIDGMLGQEEIVKKISNDLSKRLNEAIM